MTKAYIIAAKRTAVASKGGAFAKIGVPELGAQMLIALQHMAQLDPHAIDDVILGNAQYAGGNPARLAALDAGFEQSLSALTLDTQCCSGLDAIEMAVAKIQAGMADIILAGGVESYSRAPIRHAVPLDNDSAPQPYERPPFTPWPDKDPDMIEAAAELAAYHQFSRDAQEEFAIQSHKKARAAEHDLLEIVPLQGALEDEFTRNLDKRLCARLPALAGAHGSELTAATIAVEADAAAGVVVVSEAGLQRLAPTGAVLQILGINRVGSDPTQPGLAPIEAVSKLMGQLGLSVSDMDVVELMEAFASQAMACVQGLGINPQQLNRGGGALARGHPTGASGAILAVRLFYELKKAGEGSTGLATIAAAGGLGSAIVAQCVKA